MIRFSKKLGFDTKFGSSLSFCFIIIMKLGIDQIMKKNAEILNESIFYKN